MSPVTCSMDDTAHLARRADNLVRLTKKATTNLSRLVQPSRPASGQTPAATDRGSRDIGPGPTRSAQQPIRFD